MLVHIAANIPENRRYFLVKEAFKTATKLDDLCVVKNQAESKHRMEH